jgi:choline dehydrogenase-like flavoprotein
MVQLSVPSTLGFKRISSWTLSATEMRDAMQEGRMRDAANQRLATDINLAVMNVASSQGTLVVPIATAAGNYDNVALCDSIMNEQGIPAMDRYLALSSRDYNGMASNLAVATRSPCGDCMSAEGRSLELYFIEGRPDGMLTAEVFNWTGHVLMTPRTQLTKALARREASYTGVYLLLGEVEGAPRAYIGEGEDTGERIRSHDIRNLFVCDGSSFVTSGRGQPTMTIQALAFRAGDHIAQFAKRGEI